MLIRFFQSPSFQNHSSKSILLSCVPQDHNQSAKSLTFLFGLAILGVQYLTVQRQHLQLYTMTDPPLTCWPSFSLSCCSAWEELYMNSPKTVPRFTCSIKTSLWYNLYKTQSSRDGWAAGSKPTTPLFPCILSSLSTLPVSLFSLVCKVGKPDSKESKQHQAPLPCLPRVMEAEAARSSPSQQLELQCQVHPATALPSQGSNRNHSSPPCLAQLNTLNSCVLTGLLCIAQIIE